jgi:hypothetical protein
MRIGSTTCGVHDRCSRINYPAHTLHLASQRTRESSRFSASAPFERGAFQSPKLYRASVIPHLLDIMNVSQTSFLLLQLQTASSLTVDSTRPLILACVIETALSFNPGFWMRCLTEAMSPTNLGDTCFAGTSLFYS